MAVIILAFLGMMIVWLGIAAGISWCFWTMWCWVLPQLWVGGPENILHPSWLLFFVTCVVVIWVGRMLRGGQ